MDNNDITMQDIKEVLASNPKTKGMDIRMPSMNRVKELRPWLDEILKAIGVRSAFISDGSSIGDFSPFFDEEDDPEATLTLKILGEKLGVEVKSGDYLVEVAERMKAKVNPSGASRPGDQ